MKVYIIMHRLGNTQWKCISQYFIKTNAHLTRHLENVSSGDLGKSGKTITYLRVQVV